MSGHWQTDRVGLLGLPLPGIEIKLVPTGAKYEVRERGPAVTPGYLKRPDLTAKVFDEEGFYSLGDGQVCRPGRSREGPRLRRPYR